MTRVSINCWQNNGKVKNIVYCKTRHVTWFLNRFLFHVINTESSIDCKRDSIIDCKTRILLLTVKHLFNRIWKTSIIDCKTWLNTIPETCAKITYSIVSENRDTFSRKEHGMIGKHHFTTFVNDGRGDVVDHVPWRWRGSSIWRQTTHEWKDVVRDRTVQPHVWYGILPWVTWSQSVWYMFEFDRRMSRSWRSRSTTTWTRSRTKSPWVMVHSLSVWLKSFGPLD
jgi:hypothetical protein